MKTKVVVTRDIFGKLCYYGMQDDDNYREVKAGTRGELLDYQARFVGGEIHIAGLGKQHQVLVSVPGYAKLSVPANALALVEE